MPSYFEESSFVGAFEPGVFGSCCVRRIFVFVSALSLVPHILTVESLDCVVFVGDSHTIFSYVEN